MLQNQNSQIAQKLWMISQSVIIFHPTFYIKPVQLGRILLQLVTVRTLMDMYVLQLHRVTAYMCYSYIQLAICILYLMQEYYTGAMGAFVVCELSKINVSSILLYKKKINNIVCQRNGDPIPVYLLVSKVGKIKLNLIQLASYIRCIVLHHVSIPFTLCSVILNMKLEGVKMIVPWLNWSRRTGLPGISKPLPRPAKGLKKL